MPYRCEAASVEGFVQQLACNLVNKGYWFYVVGNIPPHKDPALVDRKLIIRYGLDISKWTRARRKAAGHANVAYLRYQRFFVLLATQGSHLLFEQELGVKDFRREALRFYGYSIGCGKGSDGRYHASVRINDDAFAALQSHLFNLAVHRSGGALASEFQSIGFTPFARIRRQLLRLLREVNELRRTAGFTAVPSSALCLRRKIHRVFRVTCAHDQLEAAPPVPRCQASAKIEKPSNMQQLGINPRDG